MDVESVRGPDEETEVEAGLDLQLRNYLQIHRQESSI